MRAMCSIRINADIVFDFRCFETCCFLFSFGVLFCFVCVFPSRVRPTTTVRESVCVFVSHQVGAYPILMMLSLATTHTAPHPRFVWGGVPDNHFLFPSVAFQRFVHTIDIIYTTQWRPCKQMRDGTEFLKSPADHTVTRVSDRSGRRCAQKCFATNGAASPLSRARRATSRSRSRTRLSVRTKCDEIKGGC
jgi:hypothetical protein